MERLDCVLVDKTDSKNCICVSNDDIEIFDSFLISPVASSIRKVSPNIIKFLKEFPNVKYVVSEEHPIKFLLVEANSITESILSDIIDSGKMVDKNTILVSSRVIDIMISNNKYIVNKTIQHLNNEIGKVMPGYPTSISDYITENCEVRYAIAGAPINKTVYERLINFGNVDRGITRSILLGSYEYNFLFKKFTVNANIKDVIEALESFYYCELPDELKDGDE